MRILVTGSEGTLGRPLCAHLIGAGHEVHRVDLQHSRHPNYTRADVADYRELTRAFEEAQPAVVYHLAAEFGRLNGEGWYERLWRTNAIGTRNVLELCRLYGTQLIFASSSEIYGEAEQDVLHEAIPNIHPLQHHNEYALSKWVNEVQISNFSRRDETDMPEPIICRFFNAYGPGEEYHSYRSVVALFTYRALTGQPFDVYQGYSRTFMFIEDFIPTLARVCEQGNPGQVYNIGGTDYRSVEELADIVIEATGADPKLVGLIENDVHNVVSKRPDITRAAEDLQHDPKITLEVGVPATVGWMRNHYGLRT